MKPINVDLSLNGTKITSLDDLENNLCAEILEPFRSGELTKWLRVNDLNEQADAVEKLITSENTHEVQLLKNLCDIFRIVEEEEVRESLEIYKLHDAT